MSAGLGRWYRLLLHVYPPGARRAELLDTLLEAAGPQRWRPTARESVNLFVYGMRARLGRPRSRSVVALAVVMMVVGGFFGAVGAIWLTWAVTARPMPAGIEVEQLKAMVFPGMAVRGDGKAGLFSGTYDAAESIRYGHASYEVDPTPASQNVRTFTAEARDRLESVGWHIHWEDAPPERGVDAPGDVAYAERSTGAFWATRDGLALYFFDSPWYSYTAGRVGFELSRVPPPWINSLAVPGALLGALAGWLLTGWASRRTEQRVRAGFLSVVLAWLAVGFLLPGVVATIGNVYRSDAVPHGHLLSEPGPSWAPLFSFPLFHLAALLILISLGRAAWPRGCVKPVALSHFRW